MARIDSALPSPRIVNGNIYWYENDEFELSLKLELCDADGKEITLTDADTATLTVRNDRGETVKEFVFENIENNFLYIAFDSETTSLFKKGKYFYDIRLGGTYVTTVVKENVMKVE